MTVMLDWLIKSIWGNKYWCHISFTTFMPKKRETYSGFLSCYLISSKIAVVTLSAKSQNYLFWLSYPVCAGGGWGTGRPGESTVVSGSIWVPHHKGNLSHCTLRTPIGKWDTAERSKVGKSQMQEAPSSTPLYPYRPSLSTQHLRRGQEGVMLKYSGQSY